MNASNNPHSIITTVVDCLRHGEVDGAGRFQGSSDIPLTANGWRQMAQQTCGGEWDRIISSPLRRCWDFADDFAKSRQIVSQRRTGWSEFDFGDWEGKSATQIEQLFPGQLADFYRDPCLCSPANGESYPAFANRVLAAWLDLLNDYAGEKLLLVTHAGPIRVLFTEILQLSTAASFRIDVPNACLTRFTCFQDQDTHYIQMSFHKPV